MGREEIPETNRKHRGPGEVTEMVAVWEGLPEKLMFKLNLEKALGNVWAGQMGAALLLLALVQMAKLPRAANLGVGVRTR